MSRTKLSGAIALLIGAMGLTPAPSAAQAFDKPTYYTFSNPVEIPGAVLPAGKYLFHFVDGETNRRVLQVQSGDGKKVYAMFFTVPAQRLDAPDKSEIRFYEASAGTPPAVSTVWYAGEGIGSELIYPKDQAVRIARSTHQSVLTTAAKSSTTGETKAGSLTRVSPAGADSEYSADAKPAAPAGRSFRESVDGDVAPAPVGQMARNEPASQTTPARASLPRTASTTPLLLMCGLGFLVLATTVRLGRSSRM